MVLVNREKGQICFKKNIMSNKSKMGFWGNYHLTQIITCNSFAMSFFPGDLEDAKSFKNCVNHSQRIVFGVISCHMGIIQENKPGRISRYVVCCGSALK